jgi:hypothetical protein
LSISREVEFYESLIRSEIALAKIEFIRNLSYEDTSEDDDVSWTAFTPLGYEFSVSGNHRRDDDLWEIEQSAVDAYRALLRALTWLERFDGLGTQPPATGVNRRVDAVRRAIVEILKNDPELDYGQDDRLQSRWDPPIDPRTGRIKPFESPPTPSGRSNG